MLAGPRSAAENQALLSAAGVDVLARLAEAEDTLRAIGAGEVDAFVVSDAEGGQRVFTLSTADRPYRMFVEHMRDGAATLSSSGMILYANHRLAELLSCARASIVGSPLARFAAIEAPSFEQLRGPDGRGATVELDLLDALGRAVPVLVGSSPLEVDGDELICLTVADLRAQKAQEREIARLQARAERDRREAEAEQDCLEARLRQSERLESLGQLAGGVAHDFNNLLCVIQGTASFVKSTVDAAALGGEPRWVKASAELVLIDSAVERAARLTRQLLAFAHRDVIRPEVLSLNDVVAEVQRLLERTIGDHIELVVTLDADIQPVRADRGQLEQVLVNLSVNARDAMSAGGRLMIETLNVDIDAEFAGTMPDLHPGPYVCLRVSDNGTGMDAAVIELAFEPFFTTKAVGEGSGLGLATVYGIVSQAGGHTQIHSEPGSGTTVTVLLPAATGENISKEPVLVDVPHRPTSQETVLVVEDDDALREITCRVLEGHGYRVLIAANGREALRVAADHIGDIALLVSDMGLPGMLGDKVAEAIVATRPDIAVLFMSGYAHGALGRTDRVLDPGVSLIEKPFSAEAFLAAVGHAIDRPARGATSPSFRA
jgi:signal transduction histidine kinase/ActR/RegA family two-component response regulator